MPTRSIASWLWPFGRHPKRSGPSSSNSKTNTSVPPSRPTTTTASSTATDSEVSRRREQRARYFRRRRRQSYPAVGSTVATPSFGNLVWGLDAVAFDEGERRVVRRTERTWRCGEELAALQNQAPQVPADEARARSQNRRNGKQGSDLDSEEETESYPQYDWLLTPEQRLVVAEAQRGEAQRRALLDLADDLRLRGGGDSPPPPTTVRRRKTTLPAPPPRFPPDDDARPSKRLWWLAGGRKGKVPTYRELRVRKEVEIANREAVGFWGTVRGRRGLGKVGILPDATAEEKDGEKREE